MERLRNKKRTNKHKGAKPSEFLLLPHCFGDLGRGNTQTKHKAQNNKYVSPLSLFVLFTSHLGDHGFYGATLGSFFCFLSLGLPIKGWKGGLDDLQISSTKVVSSFPPLGGYFGSPLVRCCLQGLLEVDLFGLRISGAFRPLKLERGYSSCKTFGGLACMVFVSWGQEKRVPVFEGPNDLVFHGMFVVFCI